MYDSSARFTVHETVLVGHLWQTDNASLGWSRAILPAHLTKEVRLGSSNYSSGSDQGDDE